MSRSQSGGSLERARAAISAWNDLENDETWQQDRPLREGLRGISVEDAFMLLDEVKRFGSATDHQLADEIIAALLPEAVRERYWAMQGEAWWYV